MALIPSSKIEAVVIDANVTIAISSIESGKEPVASAALAGYARQGTAFYAPGVIVAETLYVLCQKSQNGSLTPVEYGSAVRSFHTLMASILPPPQGDGSLILAADRIRAGYGCSRSADSLYIALAEELSQTRPTRLLTFDQDLPKQVARNAPGVNVHLLTI
jgi:predicted nucleic acid-binding protein